MKFYHVLLLLLCLGCTSLDPEERSFIASTQKRSMELTQIKKITIGLDKEAVAFLMRDSLVIGYQPNPALPGAFEPVKISQPYKSEIVPTPDGTHDVYYYYTRVYKDDGIVSEEELTPLIFDAHGVLVGIGREYLEKLWQQNRTKF